MFDACYYILKFFFSLFRQYMGLKKRCVSKTVKQRTKLYYEKTVFTEFISDILGRNPQTGKRMN